MAKDPDAVSSFYASLAPQLADKARAEIKELEKMLHADGATTGPVTSWDSAYCTEQLRKRDYGIDQSEIALFFPLEQVVDGMFDITGEVFGLEYHRVKDARAWHEDVYLFEVRNRGASEPLAYFYGDFFPREGKFGHAAAFPIIYGQELPDGSYRKPVAAIVANFTKPTDQSPSLLKHSEALTLFHEFGHVLHFCLTTVDLLRFSGYDTEFDFVEAPSQIIEHWMWHPDVLRRFARHHETGDPIPDELVEKLIAARDLNIGLATLRQIFLGKLDLALHATEGRVDIGEAYRESYEFTLLPFHEGTDFPSGFGHLMRGYDAGYYGYLWSKVYGDDMFSVFEQEGILNPGVGKRFRHEVLARGHSRDAVEHMRAFLNREPNSEAFLNNLNLES